MKEDEVSDLKNLVDDAEEVGGVISASDVSMAHSDRLIPV